MTEVLRGLKAVAAGIATVGLVGSGIGIGIVFGSLLLAFAHNVTLERRLVTLALLGFALVEAIALFALMIAFMCLFVA